MARNYEDDELDQEEQSWLAAKQQAAARRATAHSMAGMPSMSLKEHDELRKQQMQKQQEAARAAAITPGSLTSSDDPFNIDTNVSLPGAAVDHVLPVTSPAAASSVPAANMATATDAIFWTCRVDESLTLYTNTWEEMKVRLVKHPGFYTATEHKFPNTPANILGFFVPHQHVFPSNTAVKQFEIIVKDGKVFKGEA